MNPTQSVVSKSVMMLNKCLFIGPVIGAENKEGWCLILSVVNLSKAIETYVN